MSTVFLLYAEDQVFFLLAYFVIELEFQFLKMSIYDINW